MNEILNITGANGPNLSVDDELEKCCLESIKNVTRDISCNFVRLGGYLDDAKSFCTRLFCEKKGRNYKSVYEWAEDKLGYKPTTTKNLINICNRFGECKTNLKKEFKDYSYSQLREMVSIPDKFITQEFITPDMSKRDIIAFRKTLEQKVGHPGDQKLDHQAPKGKESILSFKNDAERTKFLQDFKSWGLWFAEERLGLKYYRCMFSNGDYIVVTLPPNFKFNNGFEIQERESSAYYCIISAGSNPDFCRYTLEDIALKNLLSFMKQPGLKAIDDFWGDRAREEKEHKAAIKNALLPNKYDESLKKEKIKRAINREIKSNRKLKGLDSLLVDN